jgi:hypothetical protein
MRRYSLVTGARGQLANDLQHHIGGAEHFGTRAGADAYRAALAALLGDGVERVDEVAAGPFVYRVVQESHPAPLGRTDVRAGTRDEIRAELEQLHADRTDPDRPGRAEAYVQALAALDNAADGAEIRCAEMLYRVTRPGE